MNTTNKHTGKLNLDPQVISEARNAAAAIADEVQNFIDLHSTEAVERTVARLLGIDGVDNEGMPIPNVLISAIKDQGGLSAGAALYIASLCREKNCTPEKAAQIIIEGADLASLAQRHHLR